MIHFTILCLIFHETLKYHGNSLRTSQIQYLKEKLVLDKDVVTVSQNHNQVSANAGQVGATSRGFPVQRGLSTSAPRALTMPQLQKYNFKFVKY